MNTGMLKLTALAALSTALGVGLTVNNAHADDSSTATTNSTTEQVVTSYSQSKQVLNQVTVPSVNAAQQSNDNTTVRNTANAQQINYPADYNLDQLSKVNENDANSVQQFDQVAKPGLAQNNYQSDSTAAQQQVDITNLNDQQTYEMNQYAIDLVNQARAHFNEGPFVQNQGTINTVKGMAQQYQDKKESLLTESRDKWHDESILNGVSENTSAMEIYADNKQVLQSVVRPFATAKGVDFTDNHHIPLFSITNMDDLRAMIFYGVTTMLFNDSSDYYSHAQNFLTLQQPILSMAVYPSVIDGLETAKLSNGQNLTYLVKIVDMHYIWAAGQDNAPGEYGQPNTFETYNNQVYYYGNDGKLYQNQWYNNWGHSYYFKGNGVRATSEVVQVGNDFYYFDNQGIMRTDYFLTQNGKVYYFGNDGKEYRDRFYTNWGHTYYFGSDGARYTNQFYNNWGHTYYFGSDGARWDNRWMNAWGHRYYFKWDGVRATSEYFPVDGETYYFDDQGIAHDDPLVVQWKSLLNNYRGHNAMIAIQSQKDGVVHEYNNNPGHRYTMASTVKVAVLAQLLHNTNGNLTAYQQGLASRMIRNSDNAATTEIVRNYLGGVSRMQELYNALGMTETTPGPGNSWGLTTTTATDQLKLLNEIFMKPQSNYLNDQSRNYIKSLMGSVNADQRWGISAGSSQYYIKNGWLALSAPWPWYVDSIGFIPQDNNNGYTIAVYTDNNIPMQVGVNMIESLARATKSTFNSL